MAGAQMGENVQRDDPLSSHQPLSTAGRLGEDRFCSTWDIPNGQSLLCGSLVNWPILRQSPCATPKTIHVNTDTHKTTCTTNSFSVSPSQRIQLTASVKLSGAPFSPLSDDTVGRPGLACPHQHVWDGSLVKPTARLREPRSVPVAQLSGRAAGEGMCVPVSLAHLLCSRN